MTSSIPIKTEAARARLRDRKHVRHYGDHAKPAARKRVRP